MASICLFHLPIVELMPNRMSLMEKITHSQGTSKETRTFLKGYKDKGRVANQGLIIAYLKHMWSSDTQLI